MPTLTINHVPIAYDEAGSGPPLLLVHAGITDRRMWDDAMPALSARFRTIRFDLQGYGETPLPDGPFAYGADARELLGALGIARAHVVGISMGGGVALDLAIAHPERVDRLVLIAPGLPGWKWGDAMNAFDEAETAAVERGDLDEASWLNVRFWLDGSRPENVVDPALRRRVFEMQHRAFEMDNDAAEGSWLVPNRGERLGEVTAPTLIVVGELDQPDFAAMARQMAERMPDARLQMMPGVAHLPPMEDPAAFSRLVLEFLG
jgi:pimeloyl-ACP methyl ester carboxylesterase